MKSKQQAEVAPVSGQHTPGPWYVIPDPAWKGKHPLHDARFVSTCDESGVETFERGPDGEKCWRFACDADSIICTMPDLHNQKANARLIASAPALLEALRECRDQLEATAMDGCDYANALNQARAAIAQAEGRVS